MIRIKIRGFVMTMIGALRSRWTALMLAGPLLLATATAADTPLISAEMLAGLKYRSAGPTRGGRVTTVAGHRAHPATFYLGATGGGVWKTTNYGNSWQPISDGYFATGSIGAIAVAPSDPNIVYVGTGSDGIRSNVIIGKGVYRSDDAGLTWTHIGLEQSGTIGALLIHPEDPERVWVAAIGNPFGPNSERGVFRSENGGKSWQRVLFASEKTGAVDLEFAPDNPDEIYATLWTVDRKPWTIISGGEQDGVYKSLDGGNGWTRLAGGLPTGLVGKSDLAVTTANPSLVYVLVEAPGGEGGVYRSEDRGMTWTQTSDFQPVRNRPFYYTNLEAHPTQPDTIWAMAEGFWLSTDGGKEWQRKRTPHGDNHDMWINPDNPDLFIQANDGGANVTLDGGLSWSTQHNQSTAELYQVDVSDEFPYRLYAGQQDNSTISVSSNPFTNLPGGPTSDWQSHGGCETGPVVPKPGDPDIVYANCKGRFGVYNRRTGQEQHQYVGYWNLYGHNPSDLEYRFQRVAPIHVSPHNPDRVYHTSQFVHVTEDGGVSWSTISPDLTAFTPETQVVSGSPITLDVTGEEHFSTIYEIQESPHEAGVIWVGSNDGPIHVTRDGGANWTDVTPDGIGPYGRVQNIEVSPHHPAKAYATILRYQLGDFAPYAFKTTDYGQSWSLISDGSNGIPSDTPVRVVREDPDREGLLYAGTEFGMYISFDDGRSWQPFQFNLPVTPVTDIKIVEKDLVMSTMGRGFWILDNLTRLHEISSEVAAARLHLFSIRDTHRLYLPFRFSLPEPGELAPAPAGAQIEYSLGQDASSLQLKVFNAQDELIQEFHSAEGPPTSGPLPSLSSKAGIHSVSWNLRHPGAWDARTKTASAFGPLVVPGAYRVELTVDGESTSQSFQVLLDPRVEPEGITAADVEAQNRLSLQIRDTLSRARQLAAQLEQLSEGEQPLSPELMAVLKALVTEPVRYSQPMLLDQLSYLFQNLNRADQRPGAHAYARYEQLKSQLDELATRLDKGLATAEQ